MQACDMVTEQAEKTQPSRKCKKGNLQPTPGGQNSATPPQSSKHQDPLLIIWHNDL